MDNAYSVPITQNLFGANNATDPIDSNGIVPRKLWVSPNGTDGDGNGRPDAPFKTITYGISKCTAGQGNILYVGPGSYAEDVNVNVANVAIIGTGNRHTGLTQIIGSGTAATTGATVFVGSTAVTGFVLKNVELDTNLIAQAALAISSNDTGATPTATSGYYRFLIENVDVRSRRPSNGFCFAGATLGKIKSCTINGPTIGIAFCGSANNTPSDLQFEDIEFYNGFSTTVTADVATVQSLGSTVVGNAVGSLTNITGKRFNFGSVATGAGGATNFFNLTSTVTCLNVSFVDVNIPRAATNGTNGVNTLPTNVIITGWAQSTTRLALKG